MTGWAGMDFTTAYRRQQLYPVAVQNFYMNNWWFTQPYFEVVGPGSVPGGSRITFPIDYSITSNAAAFTRGDAMPASDVVNNIQAYFTKDWYQASAKISGIDKVEMAGAGSEIPLSLESKAVAAAATNLRDVVCNAIGADLLTQIDHTGNFSDAALSRSTYSLTSGGSDISGALTLAAMEDAIEAAQDVTYGPTPESDLVWLMPRNQLTNLSRLTSNLGYQTTFAMMTTALDSTGNIDGDRAHRNGTFGGVPIAIVPDLTNTEILLCKRSSIKIFVSQDVTIEEKSAPEFADRYLLTMSANIVCMDPTHNLKLGIVTA